MDVEVPCRLHGPSLAQYQKHLPDPANLAPHWDDVAGDAWDGVLEASAGSGPRQDALVKLVKALHTADAATKVIVFAAEGPAFAAAAKALAPLQRPLCVAVGAETEGGMPLHRKPV